MSLNLPITITETAGINRTNEPVTVGIPFPRGLLNDSSVLSLWDPDQGYISLQTQTLARWPEKSCKWVLLDFQISVEACKTKELYLKLEENSAVFEKKNGISIKQTDSTFEVDTKDAIFSLNKKIFSPFDSVVVKEKNLIDKVKSNLMLKDESGVLCEPIIKNVLIETQGPIRTTLKVEGEFKSKRKNAFANFFSLIHFFVNTGLVKLDFTIRNPRAAKHPGGLWDLGDPGSVYFKDLSLNLVIPDEGRPIEGGLSMYEDPVPMDYQDFPKRSKKKFQHFNIRSNHNVNSKLKIKNSKLKASSLLVYQDSSGGENWQSKNHVNRNYEVKNTFRGYKIFSNRREIRRCLRANPVVSLRKGKTEISTGIQYFWQNFPKALEAYGNRLTIRLFPKYYEDVFELQGGEQKTHTVYLDFEPAGNEVPGLRWIQHPLIPHATPEWYAKSKALYYLIPESEDQKVELRELVNTAIKGNNTFFHRREVIDEYGWRNFGEFYADHEAVHHDGPHPLISHYNNQYDCIFGTLVQFLRSGDVKWFILGDQLCSHMKDIDIYHTDNDRPEFNRGLFWHTEHYLDAETATHRCFSKKHGEYRNIANYGGGPALSHTYSSGLLLHYYLTGRYCSKEAIKDLASFVEKNMDMDSTLCSHILKGLRRVRSSLKNCSGNVGFVQLEKVYGLDGPGRASGNALNTLIDGFTLTQNDEYLQRAEDLICRCVDPCDDIAKMDLLDVENRWMYTIFLQSLSKYLDMKKEMGQFDHMWQNARKSLIHYAKWMAANESLYLENTEKLEHPNETWAAQDIRKCNILLHAPQYSGTNWQQSFLEKASFFYVGAMEDLSKFETSMLTRPIALMMLNGFVYSYWRSHKIYYWDDFSSCATSENSKKHRPLERWHFFRLLMKLSESSLKKEIEFCKSRIALKL